MSISPKVLFFAVSRATSVESAAQLLATQAKSKIQMAFPRFLITVIYKSPPSFDSMGMALSKSLAMDHMDVSRLKEAKA
jgi:hypothetical protein